MFNEVKFLICVLLLIFSILENEAAPRKRYKDGDSHHSTTFDQKQTGEYNIQLHLKDFNVIAVVADDGFGDFGDYDYTYDYSDLTVKPSSSTPKTTSTTVSSSTQKSSSLSPSSTSTVTTPKPHPSQSSTSKPQAPPHIPVIVIQSPNEDPAEHKPATEKPISIEDLLFPTSSTTQKQDQTTLKVKPTATNENVKDQQATVTTISNKDMEEGSSQGVSSKKHGVQVDEKVKMDSPVKNNFEVVPSANEESSGIVLGEVLHYRKCATGYARDKRGRCRRIRKPTPQLSFDISRLASGLAAKFRRTENDTHNM